MKVDDKIEKSQKWLESPFCFRLMSWFFLVVGGLTALGALFGFIACVGGVSLLHNFDLQTSLMLGYTGSTLGLAFGILFGGGAAAALLIVMGVWGLLIVSGKEPGMGKLKSIWFISALMTVGAVVNVALALLKSRLGLFGLAEAALPFCMFMAANGEKKRREASMKNEEPIEAEIEEDEEAEPEHPARQEPDRVPPKKVKRAKPEPEPEPEEDEGEGEEEGADAEPENDAIDEEPEIPESSTTTDVQLVPLEEQKPQKPVVLTPDREEMADELEEALEADGSVGAEKFPDI